MGLQQDIQALRQKYPDKFILVLTCPADKAERIINGLADRHGYQEFVPDRQPGARRNTMKQNPETRAEFARKVVGSFLLKSVAEQELNNDVEKLRRDKSKRIQEELVIDIT